MEKAEAWARMATPAANTSASRDAVKTEKAIAELFSKLDTSNESRLEKSFSSALSQARALVQEYRNRYNMLISDVGLAGATNNISKFSRIGWKGSEPIYEICIAMH